MENNSTNQQSVVSGDDVEAGFELTHERYVTEDGQVVNPGVAKAEWDRVFARSGLDPKGIVEYNID